MLKKNYIKQELNLILDIVFQIKDEIGSLIGPSMENIIFSTKKRRNTTELEPRNEVA